MGWFIPVAAVTGLMSTRTALRARPSRAGHRDRSWWILLVLGWLPMACWALSQFVIQD
jgi:hypothetical protein